MIDLFLTENMIISQISTHIVPKHPHHPVNITHTVAAAVKTKIHLN